MLLPSVVAFNCNILSGGDLYVCNSIQSTNLSLAEKDLLISDIFNKNKTMPNFDFIYSWNTNLNIPNSPDGKSYSSGTINSAWIKIISLMPSVIEENILYSPGNGKLLTAYGYKYQLPSGTESGDCRTSYYLSKQNADLNVYVNNNLIGHDKLVSFIINQNADSLNFLATLNIRVDYSADHYINTRYCSRYDSYGHCTRYSTKCQFSYTAHRTDTLTLFDNLNAKFYKSQLDSSFKITDKYFNVTKGILSADNFTKLALTFNNSDYTDSKYVYSLNYTLPYYVLTIKAEPAENINFKNIHVDKSYNNFTFTINDASNCKIELFDHFSSIIKSCDMILNETNFSIKTDKTNYYENDTIKVYITPDNILVNITYANQTRLAKNYTEFNATLYENRISAQLNDKEVNWLVNVKKKENTVILYNLGVLSFLGYFFYKATKVYFLKLGI